VYSAKLQSAGREFASAESLWAKNTKDAVFFLSRYAYTGEDSDYTAYERAMGAAAEARKAVFVFPLMRAAPMKRVREQLRQADEFAQQIRGVATQMQAGYSRAWALERIQAVNLALAPLEADIAEDIDEMLYSAQSLITGSIIAFSLVLLVGGILISRRFLAQNASLQETLAENENQLRQLVESAPLPLLIVRARDQQLLYVNERALEQFDLKVDTALDRNLAEFHVDPESRNKLSAAVSRDGTVRDFEVNFKDANGREGWVLLSAQPVRYMGVVCLLVALADIDKRKRQQDDMRRKAMHDTLTGLPNRAMFMESLERAVHKARRRSSRCSVLFLDLDHFKEVNDTMGHHAGDILLQEIARRLDNAVRQSDLVARLAGDEFVVLIEEHGGPEEVMIVAQKVSTALQQPVPIDQREARVSGSIGIASFPEDGTDVSELVKNADAAMYQAKERGRNNFQFYSPELNALSSNRLEQEKRLQVALEHDEFFLEYMPEMDLTDGRIKSVETLLRWRHPVDGVLLPGSFVPLAEQTGAILPIGEWVLERSLADLRSWIDLGIDIQLAVNMSARQLQQPDLVDNVSACLQRHGIDPARLCIEISETALIANRETADGATRALRALGVEVAIDNFGTGQASLDLVRGLPIQMLKIDRSLVFSCPGERESAAIVQAVAAMSHSLGIRVMAVGVETEEQRQLVRTLGCDAMQGYLAARPTDAAGIAAMTRAAAEHTLFA
ncbi:MAG: EAL domain-containing protein, partial [Usitatibacter sp.]